MENTGHAANEALTVQIEQYLNSHYEGISERNLPQEWGWSERRLQSRFFW